MMKSEYLKETVRGKKVAADGLTGHGAGISADHGKGVGNLGSPGGRKRPLTSAEKAYPGPEKEHKMLEDGGVRSPALVPRIRIGKCTFQEAICSHRLYIIISHKFITSSPSWVS